MKIIPIILLIILSSIRTSYGQTSTKEIDEALHEFVNAYNEFDGQKIKSFMVNDPFYVWLDQGYLVSLDDFNKLKPVAKQENESEFKYELVEKDIKVLNSKSAVAICKILSSWNDNNDNMGETKWIYTIVFEKKKGDWLIATIHSSALKEVRNF